MPRKKKEETKEAAARSRKPPVLMPKGKYVNLPVNKVEDTWLLLWKLSPRSSEKFEPELMEAIYKRAGVLLKKNGWKIPEQEK